MQHRYPPVQLIDRALIKALGYPAVKIALTSLVAGTLLLSVSMIGGTLSSFLNKEGALANAFNAGTWESDEPLLLVTLSTTTAVDIPDDATSSSATSTPPAPDPAPPVELSDPQIIEVPSVDASTTPPDTQ